MPFKRPSIETLARELCAGDFRNNHILWDSAALQIRDLFRIQRSSPCRSSIRAVADVAAV
jgi:hypothetical protein